MFTFHKNFYEIGTEDFDKEPPEETSNKIGRIYFDKIVIL